jgi:hypothetical protein
MSTEPEDRRNLVLRLPHELLDRIDRYTADRGGSRHSAILHLLDLGIGSDAEIARRVDAVKNRLRQKIERDLTETHAT